MRKTIDEDTLQALIDFARGQRRHEVAGRCPTAEKPYGQSPACGICNAIRKAERAEEHVCAPSSV